MNGFEHLPGLLDDPQFQLPDLPTLTDFHIAPLRNPAPSRNGNAPLPLEPLNKGLDPRTHSSRKELQIEDESEAACPPYTKVVDILSNQEAKKPHLAISELVDTQQNGEIHPLQLPSFVSLSVVEKSPIPPPSYISPNKRPRLDLESDIPHHEVNRLLPRPAKKAERKSRPVPLLPAMVTGLHEPPPSAGLLPSMDPDARPARSNQNPSKILVKDILVEDTDVSHRKPPEAMLNTPKLKQAKPPNTIADTPEEGKGAQVDTEPDTENNEPIQQSEDGAEDVVPLPSPSGPQLPLAHRERLAQSPTATTSKPRRQRRKWSDQETKALISGIEQYGIARWKRILADPAYDFVGRTSVDLKDRYRVLPKDSSGKPLPYQTIPAPSKDTETTPTINANGQPRRRRNLWSAEEDNLLIKGVQIHGFQWTAIHDDPDLDLGHRKATDLRDRIRNLMPDMYKSAETRPSRKDISRQGRQLPMSRQEVEESPHKSEDPNFSEPVKQIGQQKSKRKSKKEQDIAAKVKVNEGLGQSGEHAGVRLPPLDLEDGDPDWEDNTLPPLLEWDDIGM